MIVDVLASTEQTHVYTDYAVDIVVWKEKVVQKSNLLKKLK
jgi:hypothetical protein